jgi:hypothetical protein
MSNSFPAPIAEDACASATQVAVKRTDKVREAVYLDTPIVSAISQILPFYNDGIFGPRETPLLLTVKPIVNAQLLFTNLPKGIDIRKTRRSLANRVSFDDGAVIFYPFNSQSNMNAVANRLCHHVLTLHGESNKFASIRPAARLYDYICVAGEHARDRYLQAGIFTNADADNGRLVMMGDSFVQNAPWIRAAAPGEDGALLYCPTWEGYGNAQDNYCSIGGLRGFHILERAAKAADIKKIIVKPHPYFGLLKPAAQRDFFSGVRWLVSKGFDVQLALFEANLLSCIGSGLFLRKLPRIAMSAICPIPIKLGVGDVSGMEAVFLKQMIPHLTITQAADVPVGLQDFYNRKAVFEVEEVVGITKRYLECASEIDDAHRARIFSWHDPDLKKMNGQQRRRWLTDYIRQDPFWRKHSPSGLEG